MSKIYNWTADGRSLHLVCHNRWERLLNLQYKITPCKKTMYHGSYGENQFSHILFLYIYIHQIEMKRWKMVIFGYSWNWQGCLTSCGVLPIPSATVVEQCNKEHQSLNCKTVLLICPSQLRRSFVWSLDCNFWQPPYLLIIRLLIRLLCGATCIVYHSPTENV